MNSELTKLGAAVSAASKQVATESAALRKAQTAAGIAHAAVARSRLLDLSQPFAGVKLIQGGPDFKRPQTPTEVAASEASQKLSAAEHRLTAAQSELGSAKAAKLAAENRIINRWRDARLREIRAGDSSKIRALIEATPPDVQVRAEHRFEASATVKEFLRELKSDDINTPCNILRGETAADYGQIRQEILEQAEAEAAAA